VRAPRAGERIEFQRAEAARHRGLGLRRVVRGRLRAGVPAVGVHTYPLAARSAEQVDHRHAEPLAGEIPERLLDPADGTEEVERAALGGEVVIRPVREVADVAGVTPDEIPRELSHERGDRVIAVRLRVALAPAVQAIRRLDLHEEPVLAVAGIDDERGDGGDLYARLSSRVRAP